MIAGRDDGGQHNGGKRGAHGQRHRQTGLDAKAVKQVKQNWHDNNAATDTQQAGQHTGKNTGRQQEGDQ